MTHTAAPFAPARQVLEAALADGVVPGAVAVVAGRDGPAEAYAGGVRRLGGESVTADTRYDLASLTKVMATLPCVLSLVSEGAIDLDEPLGRHFSSAGWFRAPSLADATVRQLLTHTAGLASWTPLFASVSTRRAALAAVLQQSVEAPGSVRYSDLGFMLLGALVERVTKRRLDEVAHERVFDRLGMRETGFGPLVDVPSAATEDCGWRNRLLEGEVHDENASVWDGVAGHAGLFGTAADVARYAGAWLRRDPVLGSEALLAQSTSAQVVGDDGAPRGLGWLLAHAGVFAGGAARGYGHSGFTGTSIWIDPEAGIASVLLTNRVHPHRARGGGIVGLRARFHGAAHGWA